MKQCTGLTMILHNANYTTNIWQQLQYLWKNGNSHELNTNFVLSNEVHMSMRGTLTWDYRIVDIKRITPFVDKTDNTQRSTDTKTTHF